MNTKYKEGIVAVLLAITAALLIKIPSFLGVDLASNEGFYFRNYSLFVLPVLMIYFAWRNKPDTRTLLLLALAVMAATIFVNIYPFQPNGDTEILSALHLPIALWLFVGIAYTGGKWNNSQQRMEFIQFSGEMFIYYVLIALGSWVLIAFMAFIFSTIAIDIEPLFETWILPCGSVGAVLITAWLVDVKEGAIKNLAPMLARIFTPLFAAVLLTFIGTLIWTGRTMEIERDVLIALDILLVLILALILYSISARASESISGFFDTIRVVLIVSALVVDLIALWSIGGRVTEYGLSPNRFVGLVLNLILLVNLSGLAFLYIRYLAGKIMFERVEKWLTDTLPVYAIWAAVVVIFIPPLFDYM